MFFIISILFLAVGLMVHVFKMYFLISGYNMMTNSQKEDINIKALARLMGICFYIISGVFLVAGILKDRHPNFEIIAFGVMMVIIIYMIVCGRRFYITGVVYDSEIKEGLLVMLVPSIIILFVLIYSFGPINIETNEKGLEVEGHFIEYENIEEFNMLETLPKSKKVLGSSIGTFNKGDFEVEGHGECKLYTSNADETIVIETDEETYIFNNSKTKVIYQALVEEMNKLK
ncbi:MAG: DUF3784 domain-containing protein [Sarcina sp.]